MALELRIAVGAPNLTATFTSLAYGLLKKQLRPGEALVECVTGVQEDTAFARERLLGLLAAKPTALVAICVVPGREVVEAYRAAGAPVIIVDEEAPGCSTVATDGVASGQLAARHLLSIGRRATGLVSGRSASAGGFSARERQRGFRAALEEAGLAFGPGDVVEVTDYSRKDGVAALAALLERKPRLDGVFCAAGDACATGLLVAARDRGIRVPDALAVVGHDDVPLAGIADPPLTTIRQPLEAMAREAHRLATDAAAEVLARPRRVLLPPQLIRRQSA